ncbi:hypothetical protein, partial [uncultured Gammaproteobacteria bacterium]
SIDTSVAPDSGTLAFDENGGNLVSVTAMDVAGNLATVDQTLVIDTVATAKPVIGFATGEDMYVNATETGVNLEISATGMAVGDTIQLKKNGANFGTTHTVSTTEITNGKAVINVAKSDLSSNSNTTTITATITDIVGNTSVISNAQNIVLDTTNPTLTNVVLVGDVNKTAVEATDNVLSFTAEIDSTVKVVFTGTNGAITKNITSASGTTEFIALIASDLTTLGEGVVSVKTTATDVAGNTIISNAGNFILDTQAPTAPISLNLADEDNTGSNSDNITKETSGLTISGTAEANATVELFNGTTSLGTVTANSGGNFTLDIDLSAGSLHEITAQATDAAGNVSDVSAVLAITVDTAAPTITVKTMGTIAPNSNLVATFSEAIAKGTGDIVIKESGGTITFATLGIQSTNITIGGTDNKTLTINPGTNLESGKSYYIEIASGVLTDVAGNNFAGINDSGTWAFSAASLSTTVAWSGANVDVTDGYINTSELSTATVTGKVANPNGITGLSISEIKFFSTDSVVHTVSSALINAISIDNAGNWTLANNSNWTSGLNSNAKYTMQVKLSGTLLGNTVNGSGDTSEVTIDTTITGAPVGTHTVAISNDAGVLDNDRITNDSVVKVSLTLGNNLVLASDETLQVSADGATWVNATGINKAWATADDAVTLITGTGKTLTARVIDTAGNVTTLPLSDNSYTLDTGNPLVTLSTITDTKNTGNVSVQSSEIGTAYLVHSSVVVNVSTTQAMLDTLALANKVNKVTIATANTATDLVATDLEDGVYRVYTVDIAGNVSTASTATVTIDTSSPTAPISLDLADEDDSGSSNSDNLTKETSGLTISGTAEANATVELFNGTTSLGTVTVNNSGNFTLDIDLSAGSLHNVTAQATDAAGNVSDVSAVLAITVDTAAPTITVKTMGTIAPNSNLVATFSEAIAKGTGNIVIKESGGTITFATLDIQSANITIGGTDNKTLTINPGTNLESGKSYYIEIASGVLTDVAGNNFAGINDSGTWAFSAASLSTTVAWSGANVDVTDGYINTSELSTATVTGKVANPNGITGLSISEIKFFSTDSVVHTVSSALINAISIDNTGNWTLANNSNWTSGLNSNTKYAIQVKLSGTLLGNTVNGSGDTSEVTIDTTIVDAPVGTHTVAISNDTGILANDLITNDSVVKVGLTLGNNLVLATDETLQVSANGATWVNATGINKAWTTADDAVTLIAGTGKTLTARVIDTAGNVTALPLSDNSYTLDTSAPSVLAGTHTVVISNDTGIDGDRITSDAQVKVTLSLGNDLILATDETLQVSANGADWVTATGSNKAWTTADDAVTLIAGTGKTLTARVVDTAGNVTALTLSGNGYTLDTSAPSVLAGTHTVVISNDTGIDGDLITSDDQVKVTLSLGNDLILATDETLQVSANGTDWVVATGNNKAWATADDAVTLITGTGKTLTARVIDTAGNVTALTLSDNGYTLDTGNPLVTLNTTTDTKNTGNVSVQSSETGTAYLVHSSVVVNVSTTQAMLDTLVSANKVNKVTIATANTATDLAATDLEDGVYRVYTVDIAGNVSTASTATVTIDTSSPTAPISLDLANEDDSGSSNSDNLTKETSGLTISGTAEANATVKLFNGITSLGTVTANSGGNFTLDIDLSAGSVHNITAQATDVAGNVSDVSAVLAITVDIAAPTITVKTMGTIAPNSNLVATFSEAIAKGTGDIVIKESGGGTFATLGIQNSDITISGTDNKTLTINPNTNLESGKSYYIEMASGVLTDVAGNNFAGIDDSSAWTFSAASLSTTVAWSGANVDVTDGYINTSELSTATVTGKVANPNGITGLSISEIKFFSTDSVVHTVSSALINAISIDNAGNWALANNSNWTSGLNSNTKYAIQVKLSGTLLGNTVNGSGDTSEVTIDTTITGAPAGTHTVAISNDAGVLDNDRITNDSAVKVSLTLGNNLVLATDETLQVSANGTDWVVTTGSNKTWATIDNAVTLITGTGKTLTARVIDTAGNVTALPLSDNGYTLDTGNPLVTLNTTTDTKNTGNVSVQSSETGTAYLVHSSVVVNVGTTQAMLDTLVSANKVNKVTIATANTATDLAATDLEDGVYRVYTVDIAGNVSTASTATVTIDTSSPTAPISLDLANEDDSGSSNSDNLTKETSGLTISGTAEANATVKLFNGITSLGTVTANSGGNFTLDIDLSAGSVHNITAQATDVAGNVSDVSAVLAITVDIAAPTITVKTMGTIAPNSNLVATFSEAIAKGTGDIVIKESGGGTFARLNIQNADITIGGTDNRTLTINPSTNLESGKSYYIEMASGVLTDVAGNNFAGINDSGTWAFSAASLSTTVAWSGANVDATDGYINTSELSTATVTGKVANPNGITGLSISEIKFFSTDSVVHTVSSALINAISIDNTGNWTLANNSNWTSGLTSNTKYTIQVKLSGTLLGNTVNGAGDTSEVTIDTTIADAPVGTHTVAISNDAGVLDNDRITNDSAVKVSLTLGNNLVLASDEMLQVSADGATWVNATGINKAWVTADDAVTLIAGTGKTLTARVVDTAGNVTALTLSGNGYTLDTSAPSVLAGTHTVVISNDTGIDGDLITSDDQVKVTLSLGNDLILATDETLQVSANGTDWVVATGNNKAWATADDAVTLITSTGKTLTARVIDTAGNVTALPLSDNSYTLDTGNPLVTLSTTTDTKNTGNVSVQSSETGTAYLVHSSVVVNVGTTQAMLDTLALANKVNKVTIATANTATDLAATDLEDGVYRVYTVDIAGNVSTASTATVTIDTSSPTAPISLDLADEDDSGSSNSDNLTKETSGLTISGTAEANATVELFNGTTSLGTITANSGGNFTLDIDLSAGSVHNITAQATDVAGNVSDVSAVLAITVDIAAPTITVKTMGTIAPNSNLVATFSEAIAKGTGDIVIKESGGGTFARLNIQNADITIGGTDNRTLTINPNTNLESGKSYYIEMASGVLTDVAGNNFAGIDDSSAWTFSAASLSTTVAWSGANVDVTDGYINTSELSTATVTGKVANPNGITGLSISEIKFFSTDSVVHTVSSALINAISIDNAGNWALANNSNWTSGLNSNTKYAIQVKLSGTLLGNTVNGSGDTSEVTIDTTITGAPAGTHTVAISNDAGVLDNDRITNDSAVKVSLTLGNNLVLATDETLQVSANGTDWVVTTGSNKTWATIDDAVTLIAGTGKTLTARVIDTAGNVTALPLSDNSYTLDTGNPLVTLSTTTDTKNTGNVSVQSSETGTAYLVHSSVVVNVGTTQAMLDTLALANKVNKVTIATANTATDLAATDLEDGVYRVYTVDIAGNVSTASTATVTIDTSSPTAPISLDLANEDDSGSSNSDNLTKETSGLTISGTAEANATVKLFNGITSLGTVTANSGGNFTLDIDLSAGSVHNITAQATDVAGNVSDVSAVLAITVDIAAPTITVKTMGTIAPNSNLVATFSEAIAKGTGDIVIKESGGGTFARLDIQNADITIGGTDNKTLTINPNTNLESGKSYYIEIASGVLTDVAGNNFAGINDSGTWAFSAASLSTTVAWSGANVDATDGYINTSELSTATVTGKVANPNGITGLSISEIKFFSTDSVVHTVSSALINAISIDNTGNWTLANNSNWTSGLNSNTKYAIQVKLSGTLLGNTVNGAGDTSEVTIDTTITGAPAGTHTVAISNDAGVLDNDRITNDSVVKVSLTLGNNLVLATDETLQVSANGTDWVVTTGSNKTWATIDNAVTLITGTGKTLTARVIDTAGNVTALPLSDNSYTLDTGNPLVTLSTITDTKNTANVSVQSSETGTAYLVHSSVVVNVGTTQAMLDTLVSANKVNKVTIATANIATDLAATDLEDGVYRVYTVDIAGNVSTASTTTVTIDTSSPTAPISLDLADEDDSGSSNSDNLTKETSGLTISGTAEANATVELFNGTTSLGTITANSGGNFTLDIDLSAGSVHNITAQATDVAGNVSDVSAVLAITVDIAAPTITVKTMGTIAPNSNLVATFSEAIAKGTGDIVIKESGGGTFATLGIQNSDITISGTDNKTLTINPNTNLESGKSYYIEMASGVLTDVAGNNFAGIDDSSAWTFSAASLSTTVAWSGANVDVTDGYINTSELSTATVTGKVANPNGITGLSISEIKFFSTDSVVHTVSSALINAISIDNAGNWTLANNSNWTSGLNSNAKYTMQVKLSGTLLGNTVNGSGDTSEVTIDTTITGAPVGTHTVAISNDAGVLDNDRITNDSVVKVSLTLGNNLVLASDETLQVSADGATWVNATGINKAWATADDAVTLIAGTGKTLTARVIDTAGNITALPLSDNSYTLDIVKPTVTAVAVTASSNLLTIGDTVIVTLTTDEIINVIKGDDANTPQYEIMIGDVARQAIYKSGSGSTSLVFEYTVISGDTDTVGGITADANKLTANGTSTLKDITGNDLDLNAVTATSVNTLVVDTIAPTIAITMSDTTLSTGETTAVTFTFSEALAVGKNIDNVLESVANATVRNHWSDNGRASDVIITGLDSFTLTSNGAVFGTDNIIHSTAIANTWIIGATDSGLGRYLVVSLYDKPNSDGIDYLAYSIYSKASAGSAHTDRINSIESTSDFITSGWIDGNPHYSFSGLKSKILTNIFDISDITSPNGVLTDLTANSSNTVYTATFTPTAGIEDATNVITVNTNWTDVAGNAPTVGTSSDNYQIDSKKPNAPIDLNLADEDDSGSSNSDNLTKETSGLTISGTAEANATVELFNGTTSLGTVTANSGGNFTLDIDLLAGSLHEITAQATDAAGNVSDVSAVLAITVDTAAPTITVKTVGTIAPNSNLVATFSEAIAKGTGGIVIKESDGTIFETLGIQHANITIGGTDNKTLTINPNTNLESGKSYYIEMASGVLTDVAGNNFAGIDDSSAWTFSAASLSTTVAWSGANVDVTDGYINTSELSTATVTGKVANPNGITGLSISEIKFFSTDSVVHTVSSALINAISIDNAGNWTLANNSNWTSGLNSNAKYTMQVKLSGTLLGNTVNGSGDTSEVTIDTTITGAPVGTHTVAISNDAGVLDNDRITNDSVVKVSLTLGNNLVLASDETLQVSADGATWVNATGINKAWATADDAVTLIAGTGKTLTARVIDTAGNITALPLSDNSYTLDIVKPTVTAVAVTASSNLLTIGDTVIVTLTTDEIINVIKGDDANTPQYEIMIGDVARQAIYKSGSGSTSLVFEYTVISGDTDTVGGITADANKLTANGTSTLKDITGNDLDLNAVTATSVNTLVVDTIAPTIAITMSDTTLSTGETTAVTFTFSEALAVGKNIDNVLESVANATVRNHWSDNGRASDVIITGLDSFTLTSNGAVFGTDNIIHSTAIANTWIIGATDSGLGRYLVVSLYDKPNSDGIDYLAYSIYSKASAGSAHTDRINSIESTSDFITSGWIDGNPHYSFSGLKSKTLTNIFDISDITSSNGVLTDLTANSSNTVYTATFTPTVDIKDATNVITVNTNWTNVAGNAPTEITESSNYKVNTVTPMAIMDQITVLNSGSVKVRSNKDGVAYLVISSLSSSAPTQAKLDAYVNHPTAGIAVKTDILADTFTDLSISGLGAGRRYYLCTVDTVGNVSVRSINNITVIAGNTLLGDADANNLIGGTGADTITGDAGADTITGGANADILTGGADADIFKYNAIADSTQTNADTITDFNVTADKLDLIDIITTATNGAITDVASLAKYIHAEIDTSVATNVKLYIKTDGVSTGIVNSSNANMLINFTVADAAAQSALVAALNDNTFGEYILVDNTSPIATMEETAALISADIEIKSNETGTAYLFKDTLDLTSQSLDIFDNYVSDITANTAIKTEISANTLTNLSTSGLEAGQYHLYIIDTTGNISTESTNALTLKEGNILSSATISNLVGGTGADTITGGASADILTGGAGADTITGGAGADTLKGGIGADTLTGNTGADIFYYGKENITRNLEADADTITDFDVTTDKLNLIDVILYASGGITDSASLAKYIHAEADTSVATNVKLYIKTQGDIGGTVNDTNSNVLINFTVADATAQTELVNALSDNTLSEYILS